MDPPSCSIDYGRAFSLPIGVPEDVLAGADLARYEAELGSQVEFLELRWDAANPFITAEQPRDPFTGGLRARFLKKSAAAGAVTIPTPLAPGSVDAADMGTVRFTPSQLSAVGKRSWTAVTPAPGETMSAAMARTFRWDDQDTKLSALPQPYFAEEALCLFWPSAVPPAGALGVDSPGIFADDASKYLLKTAAAARDGELQHDLLRSPVRGLVRVTRYRHVEFTVGAIGFSAPLVCAQSSAGALVLHALPPSDSVPTDAGAPILRDTFLVYDHVSLSDASDCLAALWWLQLLRFADLDGVAQLRRGVRSSTAWLFGVYLALSAINPPAVDALAGLAAATLDKLRKVKSSPDPAALKEAIGHVLADAGRRSALADFLRKVMAKLACGFGWSELGIIGIPAPPNARTPANRDSHALLESAQQAQDIWVAIFAGAPVGRPASCYGPAPPAAAPGSFTARNGFTTYDLEALVIAGRAAAAFPAVHPPAIPASPDQFVSLADYAAATSGRFALLRVADGAPGSIAYTIKDWLRQLVFGWRRTSRAEAPLDFSDMVAAGHLLAAALNWGRRKRAQDLRFSLDQAAGATNAAGSTLDKAALAWWVGVVHFTSGGAPSTWPDPFDPSGFSDAGPKRPSRIGETAGPADVSGFDDEDLELAVEAGEHLRSGHDTTKPVDLALVLALLDREGYRLAGPFMRQGPFDAVFRNNFNMFTKSDFAPDAVGPPAPRGAAQGNGRHFYALQTYGLDVLDVQHYRITGVGGVHNWLRFAWDNLFSLITTATMAGVVTGLNTLALDGGTLSRVTSRFRPVDDIGQSRVLSRRLHLAGIIAQHGEFQRRHLLLRQGSAAGPLSTFWQPSAAGVTLANVPQFTATAAPAAGANAEDAARADYLAYYALCYLAFNASPAVWNAWVNRAAALGAANVPRYLLYRITDADSAGGGRKLWHRGNFVRFTVGLDAYLRMSDTGAGDLVFPVRAGWPV